MFNINFSDGNNLQAVLKKKNKKKKIKIIA